MSIRVYFGQQLELLASRLGDNIRAELRAAVPFPEPVILVPNVNVRKWLQLALADRLSVSMGCRFMFLEDGLWELVSRAAGGVGAERLDRQTLQLMVLTVLLSVCGDTPADPGLADVLAPFVRYCGGAGGPRDRARRLWQLSGRLAGLLLEYEYHRREMIDEWSADGGCGPSSGMERAQRALYRRLFVGPDSLTANMSRSGGSVYQSLYGVMRRFGPADGFSGGVVHMFGLSQFSPFYIGLLFQLARFYDIRLYDINVCSEFWEDVTTPGEDAWQARWQRVGRIARKEDPAPNDPEAELLEPCLSDNFVLKAWGKLGREKVKLISEVEERSEGRIEFDSDWVGASSSRAAGTTLLSAVQDSILHRRGPGEGHVLDRQDTTIRVVGCPGIAREADTVYNSIIHNMATTPGLRLTDIAVLVPDMAVYKSALLSAFSRHPERVPYSVTDSRASVDSVYAKAVVDLLELADSPFTRRAVFELILNPCFLAGAGATREDALDWLGWADALGIFHSFDREHRERQEYGDGNRYTWEQGLQRLRLGRIMEQPPDDPQDALGNAERTSALRGMGGAAFRDYRGVVPFGDLHSRDADSVSRFSVAVERTYRRLCGLGRLTASGVAWAGQIRRLLSQSLDIPEDHACEATVRGVLFEALNGLETYDAVSGGVRASTGLRLPLVVEFVKSCLVDIPSHYGNYLTDGVTISELRPMRPIPFRLVYILGMKEGDFPGSAEPTTLDLRHAVRRLGDLTPAMVNRYLFLEALVSTREKLIVTYPCENTKEDKPFNPCSVINELKRFMDEQVLRIPFEIRSVPLTGAGIAYLEAVCTGEGGADMDVLSNYDHADRRVSLIAAQRMGRLDAGVIEQGGAVPAFAPAAVPAPSPAPRVEIVTLRQLRRFLANPIEASIARHLRLYDEPEDDRAAAETEPFSVGTLGQWPLVMQVLRSVVLDPGLDWMARLDAIYADRLKRSAVPEFVFGDRARDKLVETVASIVGEDAGLADLAGRLREGGGPFRNVAIGEPGNDRPSDLKFPPVKLNLTGHDGQPREVEIHGSLPFCWRGGDAGGLATVVLMTGEFKPPRTIRLSEAFLFYIAALAAGSESDLYGEVSGGPFTVHTVAKGGPVAGPEGMRRYRLEPGRATAYLEDLIRDYLDPSVFDLMPFPVVLRRELVQPYDDASVRKHLACTAGTEGTKTRLGTASPSIVGADPVSAGGRSCAEPSLDTATLMAEFPGVDECALDRVARAYPATLARAIDDELENQWVRAYYPMDVLSIVDTRVPQGAFLKVRRRLKPLFGGVGA